MNYRKLTNEEVLELASKIKYSDKLDFDGIKELVKKFYPNPHKIVASFDSQYNDEGYNLCLEDISVYDINGNLVELPDDYDEDKYWDAKYDLKIRDCGENESVGDIVLFMNESGLQLPDLYVQVK